MPKNDNENSNENNGGIHIRFVIKNPDAIANIQKIVRARDTTAGKFAKQVFMEKVADLTS
jgi:hypothetical protein